MRIDALEPYQKRKLEVGIATLTAEEAIHICEKMGFERQRDIDDKHVGTCADQMEHNEWIGMSMLLFAHHRRTLKLLDGQHRLRAHGEHGRRVNGQAPRRYIIQRVPEDAAVAYSRLDAHQKKRHSNVVAIALGLDVAPVLIGTALDAAACATRYRTRRDPRVSVGTRQVVIDQPYRDSVEYVAQRKEAFDAFGTCFEGLAQEDKAVQRALVRKSVLPICIETIVSRGEDAVAFWRTVLSGEGGDRAARFVREKLMQRLSVPTHRISLTRALTAATGWNAHVTGTIQRRHTVILPVKVTDLIVR